MEYIIRNAQIVNEGSRQQADVWIKNKRIEKIAPQINLPYEVKEINAEGLTLLPGVIDDQVHFREPGLTQKATIYTEAKAAVAGGVTSFMEMPNTKPPALTQTLLEDKFTIGKENALANYSFYLGTSNDNLEDILKANSYKNDIAGVKIFMGSSTGNMLVDDPATLEKVFAGCENLIATHCEEQSIIKANYEKVFAERGGKLRPEDHPIIRNAENCYASSSKAIGLAQKHGTRLHILHITDALELSEFTNSIPLEQKKITSEVCVHHLTFSDADYHTLGYQIKCNPAVKTATDRDALWTALLDDRIDVIATDHAPHTLSEKGLIRMSDGNLAMSDDATYDNTAAGLPLIQHTLLLMLQHVKDGKISLEEVVRKMSHDVARCYQLKDRGYIREGYFADIVLVNLNKETSVTKDNLLYKCQWSPLEGRTFPAEIKYTFVSGHLVYGNGSFDESIKGERLAFDRD
ncbi:dihydroorotase [Rhizosphaericola mali]|uniref:Dihydroorotase n=1 Tax=Rhizosphaericola mali TaxID=2545455 RepID=A0A5P2G461_9BACT|nr:dihydroorotase [Rhizosphaericola mali]QES90295.1 dihydroorotase [Rhizosphaericola mali]